MGDIPVLPAKVLDSDAKPEAVQVYNLVALVENSTDGAAVKARAANMNLDPVQAGTIRNALNKLVVNAKAALRNVSADAGEHGLWIEPPQNPLESETRFVVPLHL
ncbi:MAG: hypothetical protein AB8B50_03625 [Pirellulaceae bacterium]